MMTLVVKGADYAIRAMLDLASQPVDSRMITEQIALRQQIPAAFLSKVVAQLTQSGLLRTQRGAAGGILLGRSPEEINLRQIVEAVQGPIALNLCTGPYDGCVRATVCPAHETFEEAQKGLLTVLEGATLAELALAGQALADGQRG